MVKSSMEACAFGQAEPQGVSAGQWSKAGLGHYAREAATWRFAPMLRQCHRERYFFAPLMLFSLGKIQWRKTC
jgi:hypothetical protein